VARWQKKLWAPHIYGFMPILYPTMDPLLLWNLEGHPKQIPWTQKDQARHQSRQFWKLLHSDSWNWNPVCCWQLPQLGLIPTVSHFHSRYGTLIAPINQGLSSSTHLRLELPNEAALVMLQSTQEDSLTSSTVQKLDQKFWTNKTCPNY